MKYLEDWNILKNINHKFSNIRLLSFSYFKNSFLFLIVFFVECSRIELPLAHGKVRGARGRYPIRLIYARNIPVILMAALLANVNMYAL